MTFLDKAHQVGQQLATDGWKHGIHYSSADRIMPCSTFVERVVYHYLPTQAHAINKIINRQANIILPDGLSLQKAFKVGSITVMGAPALPEILGLGRMISPPKAKPGDLIQFWWRNGKKFEGHSAVIERVKGVQVMIYGSHGRTQGLSIHPEWFNITNSSTKRVYIGRFLEKKPS